MHLSLMSRCVVLLSTSASFILYEVSCFLHHSMRNFVQTLWLIMRKTHGKLLYFNMQVMLLGFVLLGRSLEERARIRASSDMNELLVS